MKSSPWKSTIEILEEALFSFKSAPSVLLLPYFVGTLPFVAALLYFNADISFNPLAGEHLSAGALGVVLFYVWMKCWHSVFMVNLRQHIAGENPVKFSLADSVDLFLFQAFVQPTSFIILPVSFLFILPFSRVFAFYNNVLVQDYSIHGKYKQKIKEAVSFSNVHSKQVYGLIVIAFVIFLFFFVNSGFIIYFIPQVLKKTADIDSAFTLGGFNFFNTTWLLSSTMIAWSLTDPLVKSFFALRVFYGDSIKTGRDILAKIKSLNFKNFSFFLLILISAQYFLPGSPQASTCQGCIKESVIDASVDKALQSSEFIWQKQAEKKNDSLDSGLIASFLNWITPYLKTLRNYLGNIFKKIVEFLKKMDIKINLDSKSGSKSAGNKYILISVLLIGVLILILILKFLFSGKKIITKPVEENKPLPDMEDEIILANELQPDEWLDIFHSLMEKGSLRLAVRALYLRTLSKLSFEGYISIAGSKSNQDYIRELNTRDSGDNSIKKLFLKSVCFFDEIWYGMHRVSKDDVTRYFDEQTRIMTLAEQ